MNIAATIARYLLGLEFTVFGLNGFLHFIKQPPPTNPLAIQYFTALAGSHYIVFVFVLQLLAGLLLLAGRYVPLALAILAPILVNILLYHATMDPKGLPVTAVTIVLWILVFVAYRKSFAGILQAKPAIASR